MFFLEGGVTNRAFAVVIESLSELKLLFSLFLWFSRRLLLDLLLPFLLDFKLILPLLLGLLYFCSGNRIWLRVLLLFESFRPLPEYLFDEIIGGIRVELCGLVRERVVEGLAGAGDVGNVVWDEGCLIFHYYYTALIRYVVRHHFRRNGLMALDCRCGRRGKPEPVGSR